MRNLRPIKEYLQDSKGQNIQEQSFNVQNTERKAQYYEATGKVN